MEGTRATTLLQDETGSLLTDQFSELLHGKELRVTSGIISKTTWHRDGTTPPDQAAEQFHHSKVSRNNDLDQS